MNQCACGIGKRAAAILSAPHMRAHTQVRPCGKPQSLPRYFGGMAPTAARRARPVQRGGFQGLRGNPDACRPRRGSACHETAGKTGVDARPVSALSVQRTAAMSPRFGGCRGLLPRPFLSPRFLWKESGAPAGQAPPGGRASTRQADDIRPYRAGQFPRQPGFYQTDGAPSRRAPRGQRSRGQTGG